MLIQKMYREGKGGDGEGEEMGGKESDGKGRLILTFSLIESWHSLGCMGLGGLQSKPQLSTAKFTLKAGC